MIIIADGGSTKTNWCLINEYGKKVYYNTEGYNPFFSDTAYIINSLNEHLPSDLKKDEITELYYYGAGCDVADKVKIVEDAMKVAFKNAKYLLDTI